MVPSDGKTKRGLPSSFSINVPKTITAAPVQLGEYLDDEPPRPPALPPPPPPAEPENRVVQFPRQEQVTSEAAPVRPAALPEPPRVPIPAAPPPPAEALPENARLQDFLPGKKQTRKQVNMNPETLQMVDELVDQICEQCVQGDVKASELFHALVSTLYEAREHLDFSQVKPRGKWGSPTAKAFPVSLKNAFRTAIAHAYSPAKR